MISNSRGSSRPAFWAAALGYETAEDKGDWIALRRAQDAAPLLGFQQVPEPKTVKNRVHLDLKPAHDATMEAEVARLEGLGARAVRLVTNGPDSVHTIMQDPEANELFLRVSDEEAARLRDLGFDFYDWGPGEIRLVTSWNQEREALDRLAGAIAAL